MALLGYPRNGALTATAGTAGDSRTVLSPGAYGGRVRPRVVVPLRGAVQPGESGGPVVDRRGRVVAMIFGGTRDGQGGYAVPVELVVSAAAGELRRVRLRPLHRPLAGSLPSRSARHPRVFSRDHRGHAMLSSW